MSWESWPMSRKPAVLNKSKVSTSKSQISNSLAMSALEIYNKKVLGNVLYRILIAGRNSMRKKMFSTEVLCCVVVQQTWLGTSLLQNWWWHSSSIRRTYYTYIFTYHTYIQYTNTYYTYTYTHICWWELFHAGNHTCDLVRTSDSEVNMKDRLK